MIVTKENFHDVLVLLGKEPELACDLETTGLSPWRGAELFGVAFATPTVEFYFPFTLSSGDKQLPYGALPREWLRQLVPLFGDASKRWVNHNIKFDLNFLAVEGLPVAGDIYCTQAGARIEHNAYMTYSLEACAERAFGEGKDEVKKYMSEHRLYEMVEVPGKKTREKNYFFWQVPLDIIAKYAEKDARLAFRLYQRQSKTFAEFDAAGVRAITPVVVLEKQTTRVLQEMQAYGIRVDREYCQEAARYEADRASRAENEFSLLSGQPLVDSAKGLRTVFDQFGIKAGQTEKGNDSYTADVLASSGSHPIVRALLAHRDAKKRLGTYFSAYLAHSSGDGRVHSDISPEAATGRFSSRSPNCLSEDTEILTEDGWCGPSQIKGKKVLAFDPHTKMFVAEEPKAIYVSEPQTRTMVAIKNVHLDMLLTEDHRCLFVDRRSGKVSVRPASSFLKDSKVLHAGFWDITAGNSFTDEMIRFWVAVQADGHIDRVGGLTFTFKKARKVRRLAALLTELRFPFSERESKDGFTALRVPAYALPSNFYEGLLSRRKEFTSKVMTLGPAQRELFLEELRHWDGLSTRTPLTYSSKSYINVSMVQAVCAVHRIRTLITHYTNSTGGQCYNLHATDRDYSLTANARIDILPYTGRVWCVKVSTGFILARRNSRPFITGNCQNLSDEEDEVEAGTCPYPVRRAFIPDPGKILFSIDFQAQEFRMMLDQACQLYGRETPLLRAIRDDGKDVHQATADIASAAGVKITRSEAKTSNFLTIYGGGAGKLAEGLGCSVDRATTIRQAIFSAAPEIKMFIRKATETAERRGYVFNWLGRRYYFPDANFAYKAPNYLIQGGCSEIMRITLRDVHNLFKGTSANLLLTIHDEIVFQCKPCDIWLIPQVQKIMREAYPHAYLPMDSSVAYSTKSLGDLETWDEEARELILEEQGETVS
jgi:DNA polymerase I-like protein with 3'-5' exonuclease and polymerase domains